MSRTRVLATTLLAAVCQADCSSTTGCEGSGEEYQLDSFLPPSFQAQSSLVKCIGATLAGSVFALVGMWMEGRKERKEKPLSREDLKLPSSVKTQSAPEASVVKEKLQRSQTVPVEQSSPKSRSDEENWRSSHGRLPRTLSAPVPRKSVLAPGSDLSEMGKIERQVKSILNKLTWEKFDKLYGELLTHCMVDDERMRHETVEVIARDVFKKATLQHNFIELYADLCARLDADLKKNGLEVNFRRALLQQCQESFTVHLAPPEIDTCLEYEEQYEMLVKYKTKMLGNVKLIAHLLRQRMLVAKIIFHCIDELLAIGTAEALETLCAFLETLGATFDKPQWSGFPRWDEVFKKVQGFAEDKAQSPRTRCLLKDLLDKRRNGWQEKPREVITEKVEKKSLNGSGAKTPEKTEKKMLNGLDKKERWADVRATASPLSARPEVRVARE